MPSSAIWGSAIRSGLREFLQAAGEILFPPACLSCGKGLPGRPQVSFCPACLQKVRQLEAPFCSRCGRPFQEAAGASHQCGFCLTHGWHFRQARAALRYESPVSEAVRRFKYGGSMDSLTTFAALSRQYLQRHPLHEPDLLVPVPLHITRLRQRGFNQALILCRKIFPAWRGKIEHRVLARRCSTKSQAGLNGTERRRNVRGAFMVPRPEIVQDRKVLLVDDVFTTGATVDECARVLIRSQAARVDVFTFARAVD